MQLRWVAQPFGQYLLMVALQKNFIIMVTPSKWFNPLFVGGYSWNVPPPEITKDGVKPAFNDGANKINARNSFFYWVTGITPAMCMRLENIGSQYVAAAQDIKGNYFDGGKTYKIVLPAKYSCCTVLVIHIV